jgi:hypothetical protein
VSIGLLLTLQLKILFGFTSKYTNTDQSLLWYAGREAIHGHFFEPNFYGQTYFTWFESIPGAIIHHFGVALNLAMPLGYALIATLIWGLLAFLAIRKKKYILAILALLIPVILLKYSAFFDGRGGILSGDLLGAAAVAACFLLKNKPIGKMVLLISAGGLAILWDYDVALFVIPALVYLLIENWSYIKLNELRSVIFFLASVSVPIVWLLFQRVWYIHHPYDITTSSISIIPHFSYFVQSIKHLNLYLSDFSPVILPFTYTPIVLTIIFFIFLIWESIRQKSFSLFFGIISALILICVLLSTPDSQNYINSFYLGAPRLLLTLPIMMWVLFYLHSLANKQKTIFGKLKDSTNNRKILVASYVLLAVGIISLSLSLYNFNNKIEAFVKPDINSGFLIPVTPLLQYCQEIDQVYINTSSQLLAINDQNIPYACPAQYISLNTLQPFYDRRGWLIKNSYDEPTQRMLIYGSSCNIVLPVNSHCLVEPDTLLLVTTPPMPAATTLRILGLPVRFLHPSG